MHTKFKSYKKTYDIGSCALTKKFTAHPSDMFNIMQEIAVIHSDILGYKMETLAALDRGWALMEWQAEFYRMPVWRERLTAETWATTYNKLLYGRSFNIEDENGNRIAAANSKWILMDTARRRPIKPDKTMIDTYYSGRNDILPDTKVNVPPVDGCKKTGGISFLVRRSHTDANLHVNNTKYIMWAEDDLPDEVFYNKTITHVFTKYRKECKAGTQIKTACYEIAENEYVNIIKNTDEEVLAEIIIHVNEE